MNPQSFDDDFRPRTQTLPRAKDPVCPENGEMNSTSPRSLEGETPPIIIEPGPRPNDDGSGHTRQIPQDLRPLTLVEVEALNKRRIDAEWLSIEEEVTESDTLFNLPRIIASPLLGSVLLGITAVLGLFLINQVSSAITTLSLAPVVWQWVGGIALGILGFAALYAFFRVAIMYLRLRRNVPVRMQVLRDLEERKNIRTWIVHAQWDKAWGRIESYLREYPLDFGKPQKRLMALGMEPHVIEELLQAKNQLLDRKRFLGEDKALVRFEEEFQTRLDVLAKQRIEYWAKRTGLATAISPNTLVDTLSTMYFSFSMLGDLCAIYNLRAGRTGTAVLLARIFFNAYLAGQINEIEDITGQSFGHLMSTNLPMSELFAQVMGRLTAKVGSGMVNYFLLTRLGCYASKLLRPVRIKD